jgi:tetratricopeptide (TPR) repeat protein
MNLKDPGNRIFLIFSFLALVFTISNLVFAEMMTFEKEYAYQASEIDSKVSSRTIAFEQTKRLLLEELGTYLEGRTEVKDFQLTRDQITTLTAGIVKVETLEERWDGKTYYLKAKVSADPEEVTRSIDMLRKDAVKTKELEEIRAKMDELLKELEYVKRELGAAKTNGTEYRQIDYIRLITRLSAIDQAQKGFSYFLSRQYGKAIEYSNRAIKLDPKLARAYVNRGNSYNKIGYYHEGLKDYRIAAKLGHEGARDYLRKKGIAW